MECPRCGLINPPKTIKCDCGYDFSHPGASPLRPLSVRSFWPSLWFSWLVATAGDAATFYGGGDLHRWNYVPYALLNLFTPILIGNLIQRSILVMTLPLLFGGLFLGDLLGRRMKVKSLRVLYNLLCLFALTAAIDTITWGSPLSIQRALMVFLDRP